MAKGLRTAIVIVIIIVILLIVTFLLRDTYSVFVSDYGTWSDFSPTFCLNEGQGCNVLGTQKRIRNCTPNPSTGFGCIDTTGKHTFRPESLDQECNVLCFTSVWDEISSTPCSVFDDEDGTMLSATQSCRNPDQFTYISTQRQCVAQDDTGPNACIKQDGSPAVIGEVESVITPCSTVPDCFQGTWEQCGLGAFTLEDCGGIDTECGEVLAITTPARCVQTIAGEPTEVPPINCYPPDDPGPCPGKCFNFPCIAYPPGYTNIGAFISDGSMDVFVEIEDDVTGDKIEADFTAPQALAASNNEDVFGIGPVDTKFDSTGDVIRFRLIPSQEFAADGAFYLLATLPGNGQVGICNWDGSKLVITASVIPTTVGETFDDLLPRPDMFNFTEASSPFIMNLVTPPGPVVLTDLYCSATPCLVLTACDCPCGTCSGPCGTC